jgi:hypothetical protein
MQVRGDAYRAAGSHRASGGATDGKPTLKSQNQDTEGEKFQKQNL